MEQTLNLLALNKFLQQTLAFTEKVKNILKSDCEEAMFSLKPWCKRTVTKLENSGNSCICIKSETEVEEIATNISRTLLQTQQLREKLSSNVIKGKKYLKQSSVSEIYNPCAPDNGKRIENITLGISNNNKLQFVETRNTNKTTEKTKNGTKPPVTKSAKVIEDKNFIAINKRSIKNMTEIKKHKNINYKLENNYKPNCSIVKNECVKLDRKSGAASTTELKSLIEKISSHSSSSMSNTNDGNCPIHDGVTSQVTYEQNFITMDVVDSIKEFNIPGEIIKPLKAYHAYLSNGFSGKLPDNRKRQKMCNIFLIEFNKLDNTIQNESLDKSDNVVLLGKFISEFSNFFVDDKEISTSTNLRKTYAKLNLMWKKYDAKKFDNSQIWKSHVQKTLMHNYNIGSMSNGIWNLDLNSKYFKEIRRVQCVPYSNKHRLLLFFEMMQQLQQIKYFRDLVDIILKEVLPNVITSFDATKPEYIKLYKMMYILYQGLNPKIPVLYTYTKKRLQFGGHCSFSDNENVLVDIKPHAGYASNYIQVDPATHGTQCGKSYSVHEVNTNTATFKDSSMCHSEGGWPKDLNVKDTEQVVRYKRKIEKDELYIHTMLQLLPPMEHCILQNNTCNIYEQYFSYMEPVSLTQRAYSRTVNVYRDSLPTKRQITHLSWSPDQGNYFAASYCNTDFRRRANENPTSYIWDVENPNTPCMTLKPFCPILTLEYNPKDCNILVSGLTTGQVACWDIRKGPEPVEISPIESSHRDVCNKVLWINSKTGTEFFSASKDGQIMWWDTRKLQKSTERLVIDLCKPEDQNIDNATGISALQFEPSMGTRFMCGLENGVVISGNRKGKTPSEKIATRFKAQYGPVIGLERNPTFVKNFITIGDWTARIWSEDCKESCIAWTPGHRNFLMGGTWSVTRFSVFFLIKMDGTLDVWDLLFQQDSPILSIKVCDEVLTCIQPHEQGQLAAVANKNGTTFLLELSEALTTNQKNDKLLFTTLLDRETRREKVIEAKNRELRLKMKSLRNANIEIDYSTGNTKTDEKLDSKNLIPDTNDAILNICEQEYENAIETEIARQTEKDNEELNDNHLTNGVAN